MEKSAEPSDEMDSKLREQRPMCAVRDGRPSAAHQVPAAAPTRFSSLPGFRLLAQSGDLEMKCVGLYLLISDRSVPSGKAIFKSNGS